MKDEFKADALIFDIDGVLLDVTKSFPEVIRRCVADGWEKFCGGVTDCAGYGPEHEWVMKRHGSFNDDYDLAWTLLSMTAASGEKLLSHALPSPERLTEELADFRAPLVEWVLGKYGGLVPRSESRAMCAELYGDPERGLYKLEKPALSRRWDELGLPVAIYSGRNAYEWELAKKSLGWEDFPDELIIHSDHGIEKPSPEGLERRRPLSDAGASPRLAACCPRRNTGSTRRRRPSPPSRRSAPERAAPAQNTHLSGTRA